MSLNMEITTRPGLLLLDRFTEKTEAGFEGMFSVHRSYRAGFSLDEIAPCIKAVATSGGRGAPAAIVERLPALEIIAIRGVGTDAVDLERARQKNVHVTTTPNLLTEDVADFAVALLLATSRGVCVADRFVRDGQWGVELRCRSVGR
jgi:hydroxypyruvate reductase